jgi:PAS domain S-box-containing protein
MGAPRARFDPDPRARAREPAAAVLDFAVAQVLCGDAVLDALPAVLARLTAAFGLRAALAFQPTAGRPTVLAAYPQDAADPDLLAKIGTLALAQGSAATASARPVQMPVKTGGRASHALIACSSLSEGRPRCVLALISDGADWDDEIRSSAHAVAAIVAAQIRHVNDLAEVAERQALIRTLIDGSPGAIIAMNSARRLVEFNPAAEELSGYHRDDVLGKEMSGLLIPARDRARFRAHTRTYLKTGDPGVYTRRMRVPMLRADGTERIVELSPVQLTLGAETLFCGFLRDLTEIDQAQAALTDQAERLNCLIATAIPGVLISDQRGQITHVSHSFGTLFDIEAPDRLVGTPIGETVLRVKRAFANPGEFVRRVAEIFNTRQPVSGEQITCADGRTYEGDYWPLIVDGHYRGEVWLIWDMSGRKALEKQRERLLDAELAARKTAELAQRQLAEQYEKLQALDDAKTQFLSTVSHELRTPLTSIVSFTELIRGEAELLTPEGAHFLDIIERNAYRLLRLVSDLLLLSRLEAGAFPLELAPVSVRALVTEAVSAASVRAQKLGVTIDAEAADGPPIDADHERLLQVLDNLITNSVKFSRRDGLVHVVANRDGHGWRIDIADSGIGIPPGEIGNLFDRFVRATNAKTAGLPGTGLGLSIVKAIVELHGGNVSVQSTLGRGTTVSVYLPGNK